MGHLVRIFVGDWERGGPGASKFHVDHRRVEYDVVIKENESYASVLRMVRTKYRLEKLLHPTKSVLLTYDFPDGSKTPAGYTSLPVEIKEYDDVELFMAVRIDHVGLEMYIIFGDRDVDLYRRQRVEDEGSVLHGVALAAPRRFPRTGKIFRYLN